MDFPGLQIAILGDLQQSPDEEAQYLISGPARSWFRRRRTEPVAACFSLTGDPAKIEDLIEAIEETFRTAARYSVTSSLSRALLAAHSRLLRDNQLSLVQHRSYASALVAAARPNGVYVARIGPACVAALRDGQLVARAADAMGRSSPESPEMGYPTTPQVATEFYPLDTGDGLVLVPGPAGAEVSERILTAALDGLPHLVLADALLDGAPGTSNGVVIWHPRTPRDELSPDRWMQWAGAPNFEAAERDERPPVGVEPAPEIREEPGPFTPSPPLQVDASVEGETADQASRGTTPAEVVERLRDSLATGLGSARSAGWVLPLLGLALVLIVAVLVLRAGLPTPGGATQTIADAGRIMQEAQANPDPEVSAGLLDQAISMLDPLAANNQGARALLADARRTQDQILHIVRVTRPQRSNFPSLPDFRPAGLWRTPDDLLVLDLGGQVLYRTNHAGDQIEVALRPGEAVEGQPTGRLVTAAWSPPRGANSEGQLLVVDHVRSILSLDNAGTPARRWWPPDNAAWQRLGASAASYDDLFILDTSREELWRYPARLPGAAGSVALRAADDLPLGSAVDIATDGNLYILFSDGEIVKQAPSSGRLPFEAAVPHRSLRAPTALFAHPDLDHVWVLEPAESRVVELTNQGSYVRQFVFPPELLRNAVGLHVQGSQELRVLTTQSILLVQMD